MNRVLREAYEDRIRILLSRVEEAEEYARRAEEVEVEERRYKKVIRDLERRLRDASERIPGYDMLDEPEGWGTSVPVDADHVRKLHIVR